MKTKSAKNNAFKRQKSSKLIFLKISSVPIMCINIEQTNYETGAPNLSAWRSKYLSCILKKSSSKNRTKQKNLLQIKETKETTNRQDNHPEQNNR